jgi:hypothetical protein
MYQSDQKLNSYHFSHTSFLLFFSLEKVYQKVLYIKQVAWLIPDQTP